MPRKKPVRFVEQIDQSGTVTMLQQRDVPDWRAAPDADARERREEAERAGTYIQIFLDQHHRVEALTGSQRKLFDLLVRKMGFGEPFTVSPKILATEYGTAVQNMSAMLKVLRDQGILLRVHGLYHLLDPRLVWQGSSRTRLDTIDFLKTEGLLP
jgi:hypothetical protein